MMDTSGIDIKAVIDQLCCIRWINNGKPFKSYEEILFKGGPCPFCGTGTDRFAVFPEGEKPRFICGINGRNGCKAHGDVIYFVQKLRGYSTAYQAIRELEAMGYVVGGSDHVYTYTPKRESAPNGKWQDTGCGFIHVAQKCLCSLQGTKVLNYLHTQRGNKDKSIEHYQIGYCPHWQEYKREQWGLEEEGTFKIPPGIVIPTFEGSALWKINIRVSPREIARAKRKGIELPRYMQVTGSKNSLFNVDAIVPGSPVFMTEGEFDAIVGQQESGYPFVATGGTNGGMLARWVARLSLASHVILAFDNDGKGELAADEWIKIFGKGRAALWLPTAKKDITDMWLQGLDIKQWASTAINLISHVPEIVLEETTTTKREPTDIVPSPPGSCILCSSEVEYHIEDKAYCQHHYDEISRQRDLSKQEDRDSLVAAYKQALPGWNVTIEPRCTLDEHIARMQQTEQTKRTPEDYWTRTRAKLGRKGYYEQYERETAELEQRVRTLPKRKYASPVPKFTWIEDENGKRRLVQDGYWNAFH